MQIYLLRNDDKTGGPAAVVVVAPSENVAISAAAEAGHKSGSWYVIEAGHALNEKKHESTILAVQPRGVGKVAERRPA
jgi:hypothetical protein